MKIQNHEQLATTPLRTHALQIAEAGLRAIDTSRLIRETVSVQEDALQVQQTSYPFDGGSMYVVGIGKSSLEACRSLEEQLGDRITDGVVVDVREDELQYIASIAGTHPLPSDTNREAAERIVSLLSQANENDIVLFVISGGGSALFFRPASLSTEEVRSLTDCLFEAGATIQQINTVRKHISAVKGGQTAQLAYPAQLVSLIFSDVPGDDLEFIASGPTVKDGTTIDDARDMINRFNLQECIETDLEQALVETPKDTKYFANSDNHLVVSNTVALDAMAAKAEELGYRARIETTTLTGEANKVGRDISGQLNELNKTVLLYGGETTVTITGNGKGGRNQELALGALADIGKGELVMSLASDGKDNTDHAGGIADETTVAHAEAQGIDPAKYLKNNDSYHFFERSGDAVITGDTGSNVADLVIAIAQ